MLDIEKEKLVGIKEVIFERELGQILMHMDPRFSANEDDVDELGTPISGFFCGVPCRLEEPRDLIEKGNLLTNKEIEELGIHPAEIEKYYKVGDTLYVKGNEELEEASVEIGNLVNKIINIRGNK